MKETEIGPMLLCLEGWVTAQIHEIGTLRKGAGIRKSDVRDVGHPAIRYGELYTTHHNIVRKISTFVSDTVAREATPVHGGDIMFAASGESAEEIGKCVAMLSGMTAYAGSDIIILTPDSSTCSYYLAYYLNSAEINKQKSALSQGEVVVHLSKDRLATIRLILPPLPEQHAIAEALGDVDTLLLGLDQLIEKKRAVKQAVMEQLLTGRRRLPGFSDNWQEFALGELGDSYRGLTGMSGEDFGAGESHYIPFIAVLRAPTIDGIGLPSVRVSSGTNQRRVEPGDIIVNATSESPNELGMASLYTGPEGAIYLNSFCFGFRITSPLTCLAQFLAYTLRGQKCRDLLSALAQGSTRYNLSKTEFLRLRLTLPPLPEQQAIAEVLTALDDELRALDERRAKTQHLKRGMMASLLSGKVRLR